MKAFWVIRITDGIFDAVHGVIDEDGVKDHCSGLCWDLDTPSEVWQKLERKLRDKEGWVYTTLPQAFYKAGFLEDNHFSRTCWLKRREG